MTVLETWWWWWWWWWCMTASKALIPRQWLIQTWPCDFEVYRQVEESVFQPACVELHRAAQWRDPATRLLSTHDVHVYMKPRISRFTERKRTASLSPVIRFNGASVKTRRTTTSTRLEGALTYSSPSIHENRNSSIN